MMTDLPSCVISLTKKKPQIPFVPNFLSSSYIIMLYVTEEPEFPVGPFGMNEGLERPIQLFDGHFLLSILVNGRAKWE